MRQEGFAVCWQEPSHRSQGGEKRMDRRCVVREDVEVGDNRKGETSLQNFKLG